MALDKSGSRVASIYSWIPSRRTARPYEIFFVSSLIQCFWLMLIGDKLSPWAPLIQFEPWSCGSINNGHLEHDEMIDAFSNDIVSDGRPSFFHLALIASVDKIFNGSIPSVIGMAFSLMLGNQLSLHNYCLNLAENAPM